MELTKGMQKAIQYIEDNLLRDLDVNVIAGNAYMSPFHFQRLFFVLSGMTLGEYIRSRRLSLAAVDLQSRDVKIIDLAMKYGYDTPESFSRAFVRFHGLLPSAAKAKGVKFKSFSPLSIKVSLKGGSVLTYSIEEMEGFKLIGKAIRHGGWSRDGYEVSTQLWQQCHADGTIQELTEYSTSPRKELIGLADGTSFDGETQLYYVATIYDQGMIPEGYIVKELPPRTWIKFICGDLIERNADAEIWQRIYSEYFPISDYVPNEYQMVVYPIGDDCYPDAMGEVWVEVII
jgi:AraC family transcriptional regulator